MKVFSYKKLAALLAEDDIKSSGIARKAKLNPATLWGLKTGRTEPKINTLCAIAYVLNKPIEYFLIEEKEGIQQELPIHGISTKKKQDFSHRKQPNRSKVS